jgi:hypothetical protein
MMFWVLDALLAVVIIGVRHELREWQRMADTSWTDLQTWIQRARRAEDELAHVNDRRGR